MRSEKKKAIVAKAKLFAVLGAFGLVAAWLLARLFTVGLSFDTNPLSVFFSLGYSAVFEAVISDPFSIAWSEQAVWMSALVAFVLPFGIGWLSVGKGFDANYDTGKEHGDAHLATEAEMAALLDSKFPFNNFQYTRHTGLPLKGWDKKTKKALDSRNYNMLCYGISGRGKTYFISKPTIMRSVGAKVPFVESGWQNIFEHLYLKSDTNKALAPLKPALKGLYDLKLACDKRKYEHLLTRAQKKGLGEGFDLIVTDPKGDDLRDIGHLHRMAGQEISVLNLVDLEASMGYNPLSYIKTQEIDIKDPDCIEVKFRGSSWSNDKEGNQVDVDSFSPEGSITLGSDQFVGERHSSAKLATSVTTTTTSYTDLESLPDNYKAPEDVAALMDDFKFMREQMGGTREIKDKDGNAQSVTGCEKVAEIVETQTYDRSTCVIDLAISNNGVKRRNGHFEIEVEDALDLKEITYVYEGFAPTQAFHDSVKIDRKEGTDIWTFDFAGLPGSFPSSKLSPKPTIRFVMLMEVRPMVIPDGVDLAKTVNTLVENLGTKNEAGGGEDPFWEDAKRLFFMALISYQFERYIDPAYHTIPVMCDLMDAALPDGGDVSAPSPLKVMMDVWEYAKRPAPRSSNSNSADMRGVREKREKFVKTDNPPHDRSKSLALHCYRAFAAAAPETVQSIVISCQTALIKLLSPQVKRILSKDELCLDKFGDPGNGRVLYLIINDNDKTYSFFTALCVQQVIELSMTKAYKKYGGALPRHVRLELDECANLGKVPILVQATSTVRSRNMSIAMYFQSPSQVKDSYGEEAAETIPNNCSTWMFLGAQNVEDLEMISKKIGDETVYSRIFSRNFNGMGVSGSNEQINATGRAVRSVNNLNEADTDCFYAFYYNSPAVEDKRYDTPNDPLYCYVDAYDQAKGKPSDKGYRSWKQPLPRYAKRFDYVEELMKRKE